MAKSKSKISTGKVKQKNRIGGHNIKDKAVEVEDEGSTNHLKPHFSFKSVCNNHFLLSDWTSRELSDLIQTFKTLESMSWGDIMNQGKKGGLGCCVVNSAHFSKRLPETISPEVSIIEFRVNKKARLFGYRWRNVYHIIWFDRNHDVYPM